MEAENITFSVSAVLPASGSGERFGAKLPKQFQTVGNRPLICQTLEAFEKFSWISHLVVTASEDYIEYVETLVKDNQFRKVHVALGAPVRHRSIHNGIKALKKVCPSTDVVIIHDAVRPFVDASTVLQVILAAHKYGASGATRPLISTVIAADADGFLDHSLDRAKYRASEMPQAFQFELIQKAYQQCSNWDFEFGTECLHLVLQYCGVKAKLVDGSDLLWKVTYRKDILAAESTLKEQSNVVYVSGCLDKPIEESIQRFSSQTGLEVCMVGSFNGQQYSQHTAAFLHFSQNMVSDAEMSGVLNNITEKEYVQQVLKKNVGIILFVVVGASAADSPDESFRAFCKSTKTMAEKTKNMGCIVNGLYHTQLASYQELFGLIVSLLKDRNKAYTGQTFVVGDI